MLGDLGGYLGKAICPGVVPSSGPPSLKRKRQVKGPQPSERGTTWSWLWIVAGTCGVRGASISSSSASDVLKIVHKPIDNDTSHGDTDEIGPILNSFEPERKAYDWFVKPKKRERRPTPLEWAAEAAVTCIKSGTATEAQQLRFLSAVGMNMTLIAPKLNEEKKTPGRFGLKQKYERLDDHINDLYIPAKLPNFFLSPETRSRFSSNLKCY
ncbi:hypothetical protein AAMO2058_000237500 [Amorphochlora amoebiformis]